jgi:hypothetical protein
MKNEYEEKNHFNFDKTHSFVKLSASLNSNVYTTQTNNQQTDIPTITTTKDLVDTNLYTKFMFSA